MTISIPQDIANTSLTLQWAHYYVTQRNWSVFPADIAEKKSLLYTAHPLTQGRKWGQTKDLAQIEKIAAFFQATTRIGIATGEQSGIFVFECDTPEGHNVDGLASLRELEAKHEVLPHTLMAKSPSGSRHYYFAWPGFKVTSSTGKLDPKTGRLRRGAIALGIDVKGDGGMVIAPPSINADGRAYQWLNDLPIAPAPPWMVEHLRKSSRAERDPQTRSVPVIVAPIGTRPTPGLPAANTLRDECAKLAEMQEGDGRNNGLLLAAKAIGRFVASGEIAEDVAIYDLLTAAKVCKTFGDKTEQQCRATIRSGFGYGAQDPTKPVSVMFGGVSAPQAAAPAGAIPMMSGQQTICNEGVPIVAAFNQAHPIAHSTDILLPYDLAATDLRGPLIEAIGKMVTLAEQQRQALKFDEIADVLGVLKTAHEITFNAVVARIRQTGAVLAPGNLKRAEEAFDGLVRRALCVGLGFRPGKKNDEPDPRLSENVDVLLDRIGTELRYNLWSRTPEYRLHGQEWRRFTTSAQNVITRHAYSETYKFFVSDSLLTRCLDAIWHQHDFDPALDEINSLVWDGVARLDTWLHPTVGAPIDAYHTAVCRNVVGGIVKRIRHPGCKHDETLLLIGPQGLGKSEIGKALALHKDWHLDNLDVNLPVKELVPAMAGRLVIEFAEIDNYGSKHVAKVKQFITTVNDAGTLKYDKYADDNFRRSIFICTTNEDAPLRDASGGRRFLPVRVRREVDAEWLRANVHQILAEAAQYEMAGETFGIPRSVWAVAGTHQEAARSRTVEEDAIVSWFGTETEKTTGCRWLWASDLSAAFRHQRMNPKAKIGHVMKEMGYDSDRRTIGGRRDRVWFRNWPDIYIPADVRQWFSTFTTGQAVATWTLLPVELTPAQRRAEEGMRNAQGLPPMPPRAGHQNHSRFVR